MKTFRLTSLLLLSLASISVKADPNHEGNFSPDICYDSNTAQAKVNDNEPTKYGYYLVAPNQYYISAGGGYLHLGDSDGKSPSDWTANITFGAKVSDNGAVEFNYYLQNDSEFADVAVDYNQWELTYRHDFNLLPNIDLYGRGGLAKWKLDKRIPDHPDFNNIYRSDGWSFTGEAGVKFRLTKSLSAQLGYAFTPKIGDSTTGSLSTNRIVSSLRWDFGFSEKRVLLKEAN